MDESELEKVTAFLDYVDAHFITPANSQAVAESCTATCLLLFSAADALGAIYHPDGCVTNRKRFEWTIDRLGGDYVSRNRNLWELRNALIHEAANADAFLSQVEPWEHQHLAVTVEGQILINTRQMSSDFLKLVSTLRDEAASGCSAAIKGGKRLEWSDKTIQQHSDSTPPPPITIRYLHVKAAAPSRAMTN